MYTRGKLFMVVILGTAGVGKSTTAEQLKNKIRNTAHVSIDHIKRYISEFKEIPSHIRVSRKVVNAMIREYLGSGIHVVVEQGMDRKEVEELESIARDYGADFYVYRLEAIPEVRLARLTERAERIGQPVMPQETMDILLRIYNENDYPETYTFDTGVLSTDEIVAKMMEDIAVEKCI